MEKMNKNKWFRTGFISGGVASVDAGQHTLKDATVIRPGEAKGHNVWIDSEFCASIVTLASQGKHGSSGLKARFGHPNMCSEALGTFLGRWKGLRLSDEGKVLGDLYLSSTAAESPKGDLRKYVEEMAAKEPLHFGASIVFSMDYNAMADWAVKYGAKIEYGKWGYEGFIKQGECNSVAEIPDGKELYVNWAGFKSPDPANVENLPHARCSELHAADLVDDPAATDGMFSGAGGLSLAAQMTEFLDTHPEIFKALTADPGMVDIVTRYSTELGPFLKRYQETLSVKPDATAEPAAPQPPAPPAETDAMQVENAMLRAQLSERDTTITSLTGQLAGAVTRADTAEATIKTLTAERDQHAAQVKTVTEEREALAAKVKAFESGGVDPASAVTVNETKTKTGGSLMERARQSKKGN